jgi:hypothetical protein
MTSWNHGQYPSNLLKFELEAKFKFSVFNLLKHGINCARILLSARFDYLTLKKFYIS